MGLLDYLKRRIGGKINSSLTVTIGSPEVYTHIDTEKAITEGYNGNTAVYAIVNKDAQKFASITTYVYKKNDEDETILENDLSKLINRPNEYLGQDAFRMAVRCYFKVCGETFVWLNRGGLADGLDDEARKKKPVLEMYVLPTDHVTVIPDPNNVWGCLGYNLDLGGTKKFLSKSDVIHWKNTSLRFDVSTREHLRGQSPLSSGYKTLQQNNDATHAAVRMYQNDGAKGIASNETLDKLTVQQRAQLEEVGKRKINSNDVKGSVAFLQGKWAYTAIGNSVDMQLLEGKELSMKELCFLFDVPYEFFDSHSPYAEKQLTQKGWIYNSIAPACKQWDDECNRMLLPAFGLEDTAYIGSDIESLPEMRDDMAQMVTALAAAWWLTPNQKLEWMGEEPGGPEFNEPFIPTGVTPLSMTGETMDQVARRLQDEGLNE